MNRKVLCKLLPLLILLVNNCQAAVSLDRTRVIYSGNANSMSLAIRNNNKILPYLAQAWLEDGNGNKINSPFTILPPIQRLEPEMESLVKIQSLPAVSKLPQDKESLFYFSLREVPPVSDKPNTLQLALQTRIKFFYRPESLVVEPGSNKSSWQEKLVLEQVGGQYKLINPTPYYITIVAGTNIVNKERAEVFKPIMIAPFSGSMVNVGKVQQGQQLSFVYVDDYGGRHTLNYMCTKSCSLKPSKKM
ncbi:TPA: fimbria/pilus periplasmic chaperone [Aeromonas hydrophila]|uniref:fimbria/pilus periplasmic chaperone n=1 Tax=Aeromonas hydrophila TaxID=644 RepID=UPI0028D99393|nr:fimbria/pilus periplasmic chaperone [Aeromonas hydrophila]